MTMVPIQSFQSMCGTCLELACSKYALGSEALLSVVCNDKHYCTQRASLSNTCCYSSAISARHSHTINEDENPPILCCADFSEVLGIAAVPLQPTAKCYWTPRTLMQSH